MAYGISQGELATRANTAQSAISRIESGKVSASFETLRELLRLLNADLLLDVAPRDDGVDLTLNEDNFGITSSARVERGAAWEIVDQRGGRPILEAGPLLDALDRKAVEFVVIGGVAGLAHGSAYPTYDLDIAYARNARNLERLAAALRGIGVTPRGAPEDLPFRVEAKSLAAGMNFTFLTEFGGFDTLGQIDGVRSYEELRAHSEVHDIGGIPVQVASQEYVSIDRLRREWDARHRDRGD